MSDAAENRAENRAEPDVNALLDAAHVPISVSAAAGALAGAGLIVALVGVQNVTLVRWVGIWALVPWSLVALGAGSVGVAAKLMRARGWTLPLGLGLAITLTLASIGFLVLAFVSGAFSPLTILAAGGGIAAIVLTTLALGPFRQVAAARRRLREAGYDLDL
jgi:hypothetical protein